MQFRLDILGSICNAYVFHTLQCTSRRKLISDKSSFVSKFEFFGLVWFFKEKTQGKVGRQILSQLLTLMNGLKSRAHVIVMGATNHLNSINQALCHFGCFNCKIDISVLDKVSHLEVVHILMKNTKLSKDVGSPFTRSFGIVIV